MPIKEIPAKEITRVEIPAECATQGQGKFIVALPRSVVEQCRHFDDISLEIPVPDYRGEISRLERVIDDRDYQLRFIANDCRANMAALREEHDILITRMRQQLWRLANEVDALKKN